MNAYDRMKELVEKLNKYAALYYEEDAPVVSDAEYDKLYDELRALDERIADEALSGEIRRMDKAGRAILAEVAGADSEKGEVA